MKCRTQLVSNLQVLRRKPAPYSLVLQVGIQALCEFLVFARIADKARVKLNGRHRSDERFHVRNERLRHTSTAQENFRNIPFRTVDGRNVDGRWSQMLYGF